MAKAKRATAPVVPISTDTELLTLIREASQRAPGYMFVSQAATAAFLAAGLVEVNFELSDEDGNFATRAVVEQPVVEEGIVTMETTPVFEIEDVALPAAKRARLGGSQFPFDALEVGQTFFVPATEARPEPARSLASAITQASRRYATQNGTKEITVKGVVKTVPTYLYSRRFAIRADEKDGVKGARIGRIAVT